MPRIKNQPAPAPAPAPAPSPTIGQRSLDALASPARLEILSAMGEGPSTTQELAERLGRSRQSLYYHLEVLERSGLVAVEAPAEGERERRFRLRSERMAFGTRRHSARDRRASTKAIQAMLRLTAREACAALEDPATRFDGEQRELIGVRGKARLNAAQLRHANRLIDQLVELLSKASGDSPADSLYAVTLVLTPAREAGKEEKP